MFMSVTVTVLLMATGSCAVVIALSTYLASIGVYKLVIVDDCLRHLVGLSSININAVMKQTIADDQNITC